MLPILNVFKWLGLKVAGTKSGGAEKPWTLNQNTILYNKTYVNLFFSRNLMKCNNIFKFISS